MKVKIEHCGWGRSAPNIEPFYPYGYHIYLCTAANGIVCHSVEYVEDVNDRPLPNGEYELPDEDWSYDNPRWEKEEVW